MSKIPECDCGEMAVHRCNYCGKSTCEKHMLPENHGCEAVERQRSMLSEHGFLAAPMRKIDEPVRQRHVPTQITPDQERDFGFVPSQRAPMGLPKFDLRKNPLLTLALGMCIGYVLCWVIGAIL